MIQIIGFKGRKSYLKFIEKFIPDLTNKTYVEPFGGLFKVIHYLNKNPKELIYNDICDYTNDEEIIADEIHHLDFKEIIKMYDSENTFFYFDPPYLNYENYYEKHQGKNNVEFYKEFLQIVKSLKGNWIMSHNRNDIIEIIFQEFYIYKYSDFYDDFNYRNEIIISKNNY